MCSYLPVSPYIIFSGPASLQMPNVNHGGGGGISKFFAMTDLHIHRHTDSRDPETPAARTTCGSNTEYARPKAWPCFPWEAICPF